MNKKVRVASLSIASNLFLIIIKLIVGIISGSVSIISEAIHSTMDLIAAIIAFFSVKISDTPPDKTHPYGHGKVENISGVIEALLIFVAAIWIIYESVIKIRHNEPIDSIGLGSLVMIVSAVVNFFVSRKLYKVAKETNSVALEADALHLKTDVYTSLGVGVGLLLIWATGLVWLDPIVAILVALFILKESYELLKKAFTPLVDVALPQEEIDIIENALKEYNIQYHNLRTRVSGNYRFVDVHIEMDGKIALQDVHSTCDKIEEGVKALLPNLDIQIHVEPY